MGANIFKDIKHAVLSNKAIEGGQAGPEIYITLPSGTTSELAAIPRQAGSIAYNTTLGNVVVDTGSAFVGLNQSGVVNSSVLLSSAGAGAVNGATVSATEQGDGVVHKTILTLASTPVTVANTTGASFGGLKLYDFPEGRLAIIGVTANLSFNWAGQDIAAAGSGDFSMGSTITADATLGGTDVDLLPSSAMLDPFVSGVGTGSGALAASTQLDGTATAVDANLNIIIDDADVADAASDVVLVSGTITMTWINLGDY